MKYQKITIEGSELEKTINEYFPEQKTSVLPHFSILISLLITLFTTESFKDFGEYLTSTQISLGLYSAIIILIFYIIKKMFFSKSKCSKKELIEAIYNESLNISKDVRLFIFVNEFVNENGIKEKKILFSFDKEWSCYLLPFCKISGDYSETDFSKFVESQLSLPSSSTQLNKVEELCFMEEKNSITSGEMTQYNFTTYYVSYDLEKDSFFFQSKFTINDRCYSWMNLNELKSHPKTMYINRKIILKIDDNWSNLLINYV